MVNIGKISALIFPEINVIIFAELLFYPVIRCVDYFLRYSR